MNRGVSEHLRRIQQEPQNLAHKQQQGHPCPFKQAHPTRERAAATCTFLQPAAKTPSFPPASPQTTPTSPVSNHSPSTPYPLHPPSPCPSPSISLAPSSPPSHNPPPFTRNTSFYSKKPLCNIGHRQWIHTLPRRFSTLPCAEPWDVYSHHLIDPIPSFQDVSCLHRRRVLCINAKSAFSLGMQYYCQKNSRIWVQANILSLFESGLPPPTNTRTRFSLPCFVW